METATTPQPTPSQQGVSSFAKSLFLGEIHEDLVFPYPEPDDEERRKIHALVAIDVVGLSYREASDALKVREATITTRLHRARQRVARTLTEEREGSPEAR